MKVKMMSKMQSGFSLVELMVGLVIGLLATLVIMQTFTAFEGQKRTTSGTADAQTNGAIALSLIQRSVQMAGYGLPLPNADMQDNALRCAAIPNFVDPNNGNTTNLFPLLIQDGVGPNGSDSFTLRYSTTAMGAVPVQIINTVNAGAAAGMQVESNIGCQNGDIALIWNANSCAFSKVVDANGSGNTATNISLDPSVLPAGAPLTNGANFACMGNWQDYSFALNANNELTLNGNPIVSEVVNMQVQYGISAVANNNDVINWVDSGSAEVPANPNVNTRNRIKALRIAIVLRNGLPEKDVVTTAAPVAWTPLNGSTAPTIDISGLPNWQNYRYRVYETIIPLRNILWSRGAI